MRKYDKYKDSKITWLGEIPEHWDDIRLASSFSEVKQTNKDYEFDRAFQFRYGNIVYKKEFPIDSETKSICQKYSKVSQNDIVINGLNLNYDFLTQRVAIVPERGIITSAYVAMTPGKSIVPKYASYLLKGMDDKKLFNGMGTGIRLTLSFGELKKQYIPYPSMDEQKQIVRFLDWKVALADKFVREKKREIELLKEKIETICYGGHPYEPTTITKWCPDFPSDWKKVLGKRLFEERNEKNCIEEEMLAVTQDRGVVFKKDCSQNYVSTDNTSTQKLVRAEDFVISLRSFQGGIEYSSIQGIVSPAYNIFYLKDLYNSKELQMYYRFLFKSKPFITQLFSMGGGIRDGKNIAFSDFSQIEIPIPPSRIADEIYKLSQIYNALNNRLPRMINLINEYKTRLISDVTTGRVDVRGVVIPQIEDTSCLTQKCNGKDAVVTQKKEK